MVNNQKGKFFDELYQTVTVISLCHYFFQDKGKIQQILLYLSKWGMFQLECEPNYLEYGLQFVALKKHVHHFR